MLENGSVFYSTINAELKTERFVDFNEPILALPHFDIEICNYFIISQKHHEFPSLENRLYRYPQK